MPRRSASAPEDEDTDTGARQFMFIDSTADRAASGEAVRVHVMRRAHRSRREQQNATQRSRTQDEMTILDSGSQEPTRCEQIPSQTSARAIPGSRQSSDSNILPPQPSIDWIQAIKSGLKGYPYRSQEDLEQLADAYLHSTRLLARDVLQQCRGDHLALSSFLALAAFQHGPGPHETLNVSSALLEAGALEKLRSRIVRPDLRVLDSTILAVLLLSRVEELKGNHDAAVHHRNALRSLVGDRGGLEGLKGENPGLSRIISDTGLVTGDMDG